MSPLGKGLLASALTLPLVAFVAGVLASPDPVDPDRSRPVIIGKVNDDKPAEDPTQTPPPEEKPPGDKPRDEPRGPGGDDSGDDGDDGPDDGPDDDDTDDQPYTVVTPPPRDLDDDDDDVDDVDDVDDRVRRVGTDERVGVGAVGNGILGNFGRFAV